MGERGGRLFGETAEGHLKCGVNHESPGEYGHSLWCYTDEPGLVAHEHAFLRRQLDEVTDVAVRATRAGAEARALLDDPSPSTLGANIRTKRTGLGLTQAALAYRLGSSAETVGQYERGRLPALGRLGEISAVLDTTPAALLLGVSGASLVALRGSAL